MKVEDVAQLVDNLKQNAWNTDVNDFMKLTGLAREKAEKLFPHFQNAANSLSVFDKDTLLAIFTNQGMPKPSSKEAIQRAAEKGFRS